MMHAIVLRSTKDVYSRVTLVRLPVLLELAIPDVVIDLNSVEMARGYDAQLMKGIEVLLKKIKEDPRPWPKHEAFPIDR